MDTVKSGFTRIIESFKEETPKILFWSMPIKLAIGAVLGVLGGTGLLAYLSEYATYWYSIHTGIRPPLEGIPYLKATVAFGSFAMLLTGAIVFAITTLIIKVLTWSAEWIFRLVILIHKRMPAKRYQRIDFRHMTQRLADRPLWQLLLISLLVSLMTGGFSYLEVSTVNKHIMPYFKQETGMEPATHAMLLALYAFIITWSLTKKGAIWIMAAILTVTYYIAWIFALFSPVTYSGFLRAVGYGGGIQARLELKEKDCNGNSLIKGTLLLRTTDALIIRIDDQRIVTEYPRDQIRSISQDVSIPLIVD